jgi:RHS repeat-associated protein
VLGPTVYGYDGHGSVRQLTNSTGAVTDTYDYDAFGNLINSTGSTPNVYLFAGEAYDAALGLYYNRARYYNNATGRFWSMDTYEGLSTSPLSLHKYLYASANPVNRVDPNGTQDYVSEVAAEADSEILDTAENPETVMQGERNAKVAQIYFAFGLGDFGSLRGGSKVFGFIPIPHAYIFADITGGESERFDVALDEEEGATFGAAMITTVPGFISIQPATLAEVRADSIFLTNSASLSVMEYGMWRAGLPAIASGTGSIMVGLDTIIDDLPIEYQAFARGGINCITFSLAASGAAKTLQSAPF